MVDSIYGDFLPCQSGWRRVARLRGTPDAREELAYWRGVLAEIEAGGTPDDPVAIDDA